LIETISQGFSKKLDEWGFEAIKGENLFFIDIDNSPTEEFLCSFFKGIESYEPRSFLPVVIEKNASHSAEQKYLQKYIDHITMTQKQENVDSQEPQIEPEIVLDEKREHIQQDTDHIKIDHKQEDVEYKEPLIVNAKSKDDPKDVSAEKAEQIQQDIDYSIMNNKQEDVEFQEFPDLDARSKDDQKDVSVDIIECILQYLDHITKIHKENYAIQQKMTLCRNNIDSRKIEIKLRALETFRAFTRNETFNSLLLPFKASSTPFLQDIARYFAFHTDAHDICLKNDIQNMLSRESSWFSGLMTPKNKNLDPLDKYKHSLELYDEILKSATKILLKNLNNDLILEKQLEEKLQVLIGLCFDFLVRQVHREAKDKLKILTVSNGLSFVVTLSSSIILGLPVLLPFAVVTPLATTVIEKLLKKDSVKMKKTQKIYDAIYESDFAKVFLVSMIILYSDFNK